MNRTSLIVVVFSGLLACPLADNLRAMDQSVGVADDGFPRSGQVADAETRAPLSGVIVELPELGIRVISDDLGRVDLGRLPGGRHRITAERVGYDGIRLGELPVPWHEDFLILLDRDPTYDPLAPGRIVGRVTEEGRELGLSDVEIVVLGQTQVRTISDGRGRFNLTGLEPGPAEIRFTRLGYTPRTATLIVHPGRTVEVSATMSTQPIELEPIAVTVRSRFLEQNGFYRRAELGTVGSRFTRQDIENIRPLYTSDVLRRAPGITLQREITISDPNYLRVVGRRGASFLNNEGECDVPIWLDGVRMGPSSPVSTDGININQIDPNQIEAMEIYNGSSTPIQYSSDSCGVVLIWTRVGP